MTVRAIRGAIQVDADERDVILEGTAELVSAVVSLRVHPLGNWLPTLTVTERAVAAREPREPSPLIVTPLPSKGGPMRAARA